MKIKFELVDEKFIKVIGVQNEVEKEIGCIFTPSSSSSNILNAIHVCGVEEVFDYWGCSRYIKGEKTKEKILNALENKKDNYKQMKDIQIMFTFDSEPASYKKKEIEFSKDCLYCFNHPCTCENKGNNKGINPFNTKREEELQNKLEYAEGHVPLDVQKEILKDENIN